jgi:DNA-binding FrmR family transcriptional regulator
MQPEQCEAIAQRLAAIEEELRDLAYARLRDRARDPDSDAGKAANTDEKRLEQARRAVAKAINALAPVTADD